MKRLTRSALVLAGVSVFTLVAFAWPLLAGADSRLAQSEMAPLVFALIIPVVLAVVLAAMGDQGMDSKTVALLGVLSALGAGLRPLGAGAGGIELVFFLIILGGRVFGPSFGFTLGTTTLLVSALITAGVGPWLPFQMLAAAWVGLGAGLLPPVRGRLELAVLAGYSALASIGFGMLMNLTFWPFTLGLDTSLSFVPGGQIGDNLRRFVLFNLATSLGWDIGRAVTTVVLVALLGGVIMQALRRAARQVSFIGAFEEVQASET